MEERSYWLIKYKVPTNKYSLPEGIATQEPNLMPS